MAVTETRRNVAKPINHGTESGYTQHMRRGIKACAKCRNASMRAQRVRRARELAEEEIAYTGSWRRDGLILRPVAS